MVQISIHKEEHTLTCNEKLAWGYGEWVEEPDLIEFNYKLYDCSIERAAFSGAWCGYVMIPEDHPWFDKGYDDIPADVHGGLTYAESSAKPLLKGYWIGFDCSHGEDYSPASEAHMKQLRAEHLRNSPHLNPDLIDRMIINYTKLFTPTYKNAAYAIDECKKLVDQAIEAYKEANGII